MLILTGEKQKVPVKSWAPYLDHETETQLRNIAQLPFIFKQVNAMPDAHKGRGSTVGTVIATDKAIIPAAVGVDIGCGMLAVKTDLNFERCFEKQWELFNALEATIPVGQESHESVVFPWLGFKDCAIYAPLYDQFPTAAKQIGTLGGGNHFIEVCHDTDFNVWVMLHSGSRGIGNKIGMHYIKTAQKIMEEWHINLPDDELAYLIESHPKFSCYMHDLQWAQEYAFRNRECMLKLMITAIREVMGEFKLVGNVINCHHNYTEKERHFGKDVWLTRKGAIRAGEGDMGIIPGSMGADSPSYIVRGKGLRESTRKSKRTVHRRGCCPRDRGNCLQEGQIYV
jgi:tRNA-splicing ligase RtcB (3'-phosphate/5'-hydroxy nucleic acid ligase)